MVTEKGVKAGDDRAKARVQKFRDDLVGGVELKDNQMINHGGIIGELSNAMPAVKHSDPTVTFTEPRYPVGSQLIDFVGKPDEAEHAHFEVVYEFVPVEGGKYSLNVTVEFRTKIDAGPVVPTYRPDLPGIFTEADFDQQLDLLKTKLVKEMIGTWRSQPGAAPVLVPD